MRAPSGWVIRLRERLARFIDPVPAAGVAWCADCSLNGGKTLTFNSAGVQGHLRVHQASGADYTQVRVKYAERRP